MKLWAVVISDWYDYLVILCEVTEVFPQGNGLQVLMPDETYWYIIDGEHLFHREQWDEAVRYRDRLNAGRQRRTP